MDDLFASALKLAPANDALNENVRRVIDDGTYSERQEMYAFLTGQLTLFSEGSPIVTLISRDDDSVIAECKNRPGLGGLVIHSLDALRELRDICQRGSEQLQELLD